MMNRRPKGLPKINEGTPWLLPGSPEQTRREFVSFLRERLRGEPTKALMIVLAREGIERSLGMSVIVPRVQQMVPVPDQNIRQIPSRFFSSPHFFSGLDPYPFLIRRIGERAGPKEIEYCLIENNPLESQHRK